MAAGPTGFDSAAKIQDAVWSGVAEWGAPTFWARYCGPLQANTPITVSQANALTEMRALWDCGGRFFIPIFEPNPQSRLQLGSNYGILDGTSFCNSLRDLYYWVLPLVLPATHVVYVYLAMENSSSLSSAYWSGFKSAVDGYYLGGYYPLFASLYCAPHSPNPNCSSASGAWSIWTSTPERCSNCARLNSQPAWGGGDTCSNGLPTHLWQTAEDGVCQTCGHPQTNVDLDEADSNSSYNTSKMFVLNSRP
jgi:hypothetical protein